MADTEADEPSRRRGHFRRAAKIALVVLIAYGLLAYVILPALWTHHEHQKGLAGLPMVTRTGQGIPGDPINVGMVGDQMDLVCAKHAAGGVLTHPSKRKAYDRTVAQ